MTVQRLARGRPARGKKVLLTRTRYGKAATRYSANGLKYTCVHEHKVIREKNHPSGYHQWMFFFVLEPV